MEEPRNKDAQQTFIEPQAAYSAFVSGFKNKLNFFLITIRNIHYLLLPLERTIRDTFISTVTGDHIRNEKKIVLISLPIRYGGLAIPIFHETAEIQFINCNKIISEFTTLIKQQRLQCDIHQDKVKYLKTEIKQSKENYKNEKKKTAKTSSKG